MSLEKRYNIEVFTQVIKMPILTADANSNTIWDNNESKYFTTSRESFKRGWAA